jgi:hypothetical protein
MDPPVAPTDPAPEQAATVGDERAQADPRRSPMTSESRDDIERTMRGADTANGEPGALDTDPPQGALPSGSEVQAERRPPDSGVDVLEDDLDRDLADPRTPPAAFRHT